jgi:hypothetical protein
MECGTIVPLWERPLFRNRFPARPDENLIADAAGFQEAPKKERQARAEAQRAQRKE